MQRDLRGAASDRIALAEKGIKITAEEMRAARKGVDEVAKLEQAMKPERAAELAGLAEEMQRALEELEKSGGS